MTLQSVNKWIFKTNLVVIIVYWCPVSVWIANDLLSESLLIAGPIHIYFTFDPCSTLVRSLPNSCPFLIWSTSLSDNCQIILQFVSFPYLIFVYSVSITCPFWIWWYSLSSSYAFMFNNFSLFYFSWWGWLCWDSPSTDSSTVAAFPNWWKKVRPSRARRWASTSTRRPPFSWSSSALSSFSFPSWVVAGLGRWEKLKI